MIVKITVIAMDVPLGEGDGAPGESICPAQTETAITIHRIAAAHVWRNFFTLCAS